jgi:hypothetical protein
MLQNRLQMKNIILSVAILFLFAHYTNAQNVNELSENRIVYSLTQDFKRAKIEIGFLNKLDTTKALLLKKVFKSDKHSYIKFSTDNYYLSVDTLPFLSNDICNELQKIILDTTFNYGEPLSRSVSVVLIIDKNGKIETYGIARGANSNYYEDATLKVLQGYSKNNSCKPAKVGNKAVCSILRISFSFGQGKCTVLTNAPPFFHSVKN